jgi:hypothetical protein
MRTRVCGEDLSCLVLQECFLCSVVESLVVVSLPPLCESFSRYRSIRDHMSQSVPSCVRSYHALHESPLGKIGGSSIMSSHRLFSSSTTSSLLGSSHAPELCYTSPYAVTMQKSCVILRNFGHCDQLFGQIDL